MVDLVAIGIQTGLIGGLLGGFLLAIRLRMTKWVSLGFARMMKELNKAAEEEGTNGSSPGAGVLNLGGFKIDPSLLKAIAEYGPTLLNLAKQFGLVKGGTGGGENPFL